MHDGKLLVEFDAANREELEKWLAAEKSISIGYFESTTRRAVAGSPRCDLCSSVQLAVFDAVAPRFVFKCANFVEQIVFLLS